MVLTVSFVISPVIGLVCHPRLRGVSGPLGLTSPFANLTPASRRQNHTTSPSAAALFVFQRTSVHRIPRSTSVTIAKRPSARRDGMEYATDLGWLRNGKFFDKGLDCPNHLDLPQQIDVLRKSRQIE